MNIVQLKHIRMHDNASNILVKRKYDELASYLADIENDGAWTYFKNAIAGEIEGREIIANDVKAHFNDLLCGNYITDNRGPILELDFSDITVIDGRFPSISHFIMGASYTI